MTQEELVYQAVTPAPTPIVEAAPVITGTPTLISETITRSEVGSPAWQAESGYHFDSVTDRWVAPDGSLHSSADLGISQTSFYIPWEDKLVGFGDPEPIYTLVPDVPVTTTPVVAKAGFPWWIAGLIIGGIILGAKKRK